MHRLCSSALACGYWRGNRMPLNTTIALISALAVLLSPVRAAFGWRISGVAVQVLY